MAKPLYMFSLSHIVLVTYTSKDDRLMSSSEFAATGVRKEHWSASALQLTPFHFLWHSGILLTYMHIETAISQVRVINSTIRNHNAASGGLTSIV